MWALVKDSNVIEIISTPRHVVVDDVQHPSSIFDIWTAEQLKEIGIYPVSEAPEPDLTSATPTGFDLTFDGNVVTKTMVTTPKSTADLAREHKDSSGLALDLTDREMARALEDLIDLLVDKQIITLQELPKAVLDKMQLREDFRDAVRSV